MSQQINKRLKKIMKCDENYVMSIINSFRTKLVLMIIWFKKKKQIERRKGGY